MGDLTKICMTWKITCPLATAIMSLQWYHMSVIASQITGNSTMCSTAVQTKNRENTKIVMTGGFLSQRATYVESVTMGLLPDTQNCGLRMRRECRERFPRHRFQRKLLVSDPDMHHGTCVTHVPWCMSGSLNRGGGGKRSRHSRRMRNSQFYVSGKRPMSRRLQGPNLFVYISYHKSRMPLDQYIKLGPYKFSLQASVHHHGYSMNSGHYTASINCCGKTFHWNDNKITECYITDTYNSSTAYILLYKLMEC